MCRWLGWGGGGALERSGHGTGRGEHGRVLPGYGVERGLSAVTWTLA